MDLHETVRLERRPVDRAVSGDAASAFVDRTIEVTETTPERAARTSTGTVVEEVRS